MMLSQKVTVLFLHAFNIGLYLVVQTLDNMFICIDKIQFLT